MSRTRAAISLLCLLATAAAPAGFASSPDDLRLGSAVVPTFESIHLVLDAGKHDYAGQVRIELRVREAASSFRFHAEEMKVERIVLRGAAGGAPIQVTQEAGPTGLVTVTTGAPIAPGRYALEIDFSNDFGTRAVGLYRMEMEGAAYAFTQFEPDDAREAFPCWDEPNFKIPYQMTLEVPEGHTAIGNTPVEKETVRDGSRTIVFKRTPPLPSYLLAVAAGPLETLEIPGMSIPGRVVTVKGRSRLAEAAARATPPILAALESYFGRKYPFDKLDLIAVPEYWPGAMENPGAITYSENLLLLDPATASPGQRRGLAAVTAHELAHMWFGDLVTMEWWDDLWLNESFADWMGDKITHQVHPEFDLPLSEMGAIQMIMSSDARPSSHAIRRRVSPGDNILQDVGTAYNKGKAVLAMFERWAGEEAFRRGVIDYLKAHEWGNATASDLWSALAKSSSRDVGGAMAAWLDQSGLPLVSAEIEGGQRVRLSQRRFMNAGVEGETRRWRIPLVLKYGDAGGTHTAQVLLDQDTRTVSLEARGDVAWILPDADAGGYYRWSVPQPMLMRLARDAGELLTPRERIGFIGNLSSLIDAGMVGGDDYLRGLGGFAGDPRPQVVSALLGALGKVKMAFVPAEMEESFAKYVRATLGPALERFGLERKPGEDESISIFRSGLLGWLGKEGGDAGVRARAVKLARAYMQDPASVDPALAGVALNLMALDGGRALFDEYRSRFESAKIPAERARYLSALGSFREPAVVEEAIKYALSGPLRPQEIFQVTGGLGDTEKGRDRIYRFVTENYEAITSRMPPQTAGFLPFVASGCEPARLEAAKAFFSEPAHSMPGTSVTLARVSDGVSDCVRLREREGAAVRAYLTQAATGSVN